MMKKRSRFKRVNYEHVFFVLAGFVLGAFSIPFVLRRGLQNILENIRSLWSRLT